MRRITGLASAALFAAAVAVGVTSGSAHAVPTDFTDVTIPQPAANPLSSPTGIAAVGDGRALITEKAGALRVLLADGTIAAQDAVTLSVCTGSEQGLLGAAVDPQFAVNGYVYLYYSHNAGNCASASGRFNRVSRFTMAGNTLDPASELVLIDNMAIAAGNHDGGDLNFGADGYLYVTVGDSGSNPRGGGVSAARDLSLLNGKILRITSTGGTPPDNPFVGDPSAAPCRLAGVSAPTSVKCSEIYSWGLRNPYRFAFDPNSNNAQFFINDVGDGTWEEVDLGVKGADYGWSIREGFCARGEQLPCSPTPAALTDPLTAYNHNTTCTYITGGAFIPNGVWPAQYDGGYLFADGGCGRMWLRSANGTVDYAAPFAQTTGVLSDMAFVTQNGITSLFYVGNANGQLHRITYLQPLPPPEPNEEMISFSPTRLADTRPGFATVDGQAAGGGALASGGVLELAVAGRGGVAANAVAASLNVTAVDSAGPGFLTVYPCGSPRPLASNLNTAAGATVPNAVIAKIGDAGKVCIYASVRTDVVVDVGGYFPATSSLVSINPIRLADTRQGQATIDGQSQGTGLAAPGSVTVVKVAGRSGTPATLAAAVLNVTITDADGPGYATVYPCGTETPLASTLNYTSGSTVAALAVSRLGVNGANDGNVCIYVQRAAHLVVDLDGWFPPTTRVSTFTPARLLDTRPGASTVDGLMAGGGPAHLAGVVNVPVVGRAGVNALARAAILNVTVTEPTAAGYVTAYPCGTEPPLASTVNFAAGQTVANAAIVAIGAGDAICVYSSQETQLIVDITGVVVITTSLT